MKVEVKKEAKGYIFIALSTLLFSTMEIGLKLTSCDFNAMQLTMIRFLLGGIALAPFALRRIRNSKCKICKQDLLRWICISFIGLFIGMNLFQMAVVHTNASVVSVLFSTNTLFVTFLAFPILGERIEKKNFVAIVFQLIGVIIIIQPWDRHISLAGALFSIASAIAFAVYGVLGKKQSKMFGGVVTTCFCSLAAAVEMAIYMLISHIDKVAEVMRNIGLDEYAKIPFLKGLSSKTIIGVLYVSVLVTGCGYLCYFLAMECLEAQTVSLVFFFKPILAPILAMIILHEKISVNMLIGILFIITGSEVSLFADKLICNRKELP